MENTVKSQNLYEGRCEEASLNKVQERVKKWNKDASCQRGVDSNETPNNMTAQMIFSTITCHVAVTSLLSNFLSRRAEEYQGPNTALNEAMVIKRLGTIPSAAVTKAS